MLPNKNKLIQNTHTDTGRINVLSEDQLLACFAVINMSYVVANKSLNLLIQ